MIVFKIYRAIYSACSVFLLADHFCFRKNNYGSSHPCSRKYRISGW